MDDRFEVIDAFVDGERVDAAALKRALAEAEGRDYFVDMWLLRESVQDDLAREPVPHAAAQAPRAAAPGPSHRRPTFLVAIAASLIGVVGGGLGGYAIAERLRVPRAVESPVVDAPAPPPASFPAPPPTRAIPIEFSTDNAASRGGD